ncbi:MAG: cytochrome c biogenesis protein CcsA [Bacteroidales bacterium]
MKNIFKFIFSMPLMAVALVIFALSMGVATFLERDYGAPVARYMVYNTWWFELIQLILVVNFVGNIFKYKLYKWAKMSIFIFHLAFVIILLGAGITRYIGFEGAMLIREGEISNSFLSEKSYITISSVKDKDSLKIVKDLFISPYLKNHYKEDFKFQGQDYTLSIDNILPNAQKTFVEDPQGQPYIEMVVASKTGMQTYYIMDQASVSFQGQKFRLNVDNQDSTNKFFIEKNSIYLQTPNEVVPVAMGEKSDTTLLQPGVRNELKKRQLYSLGNIKFVIKEFSEHAKMTYVAGDWTNGVEFNVLEFTLKSGDKQTKVFVPTVDKEKGELVSARLNDAEFFISHGSVDVELPFELMLKDFKLDRYPGSMSPSSYSSDVVLIDHSTNDSSEHKIFMNNILEHRGYRFYQSSYTNDEKGSILSVNHDKPGTIVTYLGYFLLALGMFWSIFNKNSHFVELIRRNKEIREKRKGLGTALLVMLMLGSQVSFSQTDSIKNVDKAHANKFGYLLMQDEGGRIKPINTLSSELLRKVSRKEEYKGLNHNQVFMLMTLDPVGWQNEKMIRVNNPDVQKLLGITDKYVSFNQLVDQKSGKYLLKEQVEKAFEKKPVERDKFDKEIIAVDERLNLFYQVLSGQFLTLFPDSAKPEQKWIIPSEALKLTNKDARGYANSVFPNYYQAILDAQMTNNWAKADSVLQTLIDFQKSNAPKLVPSDTKLKLEVQYINTDIFNTVYKYYGLVGFVLLVILFVAILRPKTKIKIPVLISAILLGLLFLYHSYGLGVRWYISGHAPWSNGYESMIYIAWATMLAGLIFMKRSPISLAATALLSSVTLMVAHLSWMDPEMTNLVPVLKSYWLTIHVSVITASYGFLGLGAILGLLSLVLMIFKNSKNNDSIELTLGEISNVNHMTLILGLYLLTIGTFLGGVWANESWGRYWGWDPKETWALITVIVYSFIVHTRFIPALNNKFSFNLLSLLGYGSVMMTYFGVNYLLSGLHSYAKGDPAPMPAYIYYTLAVIAVIAVIAYFKDKKSGTRKLEKTS